MAPMLERLSFIESRMFAVEKLPSPSLSEEPVKEEDVDEDCSDKVVPQQVNLLVCSSFPHIVIYILQAWATDPPPHIRSGAFMTNLRWHKVHGQNLCYWARKLATDEVQQVLQKEYKQASTRGKKKGCEVICTP
eukprot:528722_1